MTNQEAYGDRTYKKRLNTIYKVGDRVHVGPCYVGQDSKNQEFYTNDAIIGEWIVIEVYPPVVTNSDYYDYRLVRGNVEAYLCASRLTLVK